MASTRRWVARDRVLGLADVRALAREPEHDQVGPELRSDPDCGLRTLERVGARLRVVGGEGAVDRKRMLPQARRDELRREPLVGEPPLQCLRYAADLRGREVVQVRHRVVVVELHVVETQLLVAAKLVVERPLRSHRGSEGVGSLVDVPRAEREPVAVLLRHRATVDDSACERSAAVNSRWVVAASSGVAQWNGCRMPSRPCASSSQNAAHICCTASEKPNSKIAPVIVG